MSKGIDEDDTMVMMYDIEKRILEGWIQSPNLIGIYILKQHSDD